MSLWLRCDNRSPDVFLVLFFLLACLNFCKLLIFYYFLPNVLLLTKNLRFVLSLLRNMNQDSKSSRLNTINKRFLSIQFLKILLIENQLMLQAFCIYYSKKEKKCLSIPEKVM